MARRAVVEWMAVSRHCAVNDDDGGGDVDLDDR